MDEAEPDVLAYMSVPDERSGSALRQDALDQSDQEVNGEIKRRAEVVGIVPNGDASPSRRRDPARAERGGGPARP